MRWTSLPIFVGCVRNEEVLCVMVTKFCIEHRRCRAAVVLDVFSNAAKIIGS